MNKVYDELKELNPEALIVEDFEQAYLGYTHDGKAIYDYYTMVDIVELQSFLMVFMHTLLE